MTVKSQTGMKSQKLSRYAEFILYRALAEVRADNSKAFLGLLWWIVEPILYMLAFYVVFGLVFQRGGENFIPFLLCGLVIWKWFASSVQNASTSITSNMGLIYQVYLPKVVFPVVAVVTSTLRFSFVFFILLLFLLANDAPVTSAWLIDLPLLLSLQIAFMLGLAMTLAAIVPFIPDLKFLIDNGLLILFFLSGIFFRLDTIPESLRLYFDLNPVAVIIHGYREILISGNQLNWLTMLPVVIMSFCMLALGGILLRRWDRVYAKKAFL